MKKRLLAVSILAATAGAPGITLAEEQLALEEILVTARKRVESLQDVPVSVTAFNTDSLKSRDLRTLEDLAGSTTGLVFENFPTSGLSAAPVIRGMSLPFTTAREQNTSVFLDGIYLQRQSMLNPGLVEMERVEVVKGPQSALYGRNAFAGAINYVTAKPTDEFSGHAGITLGTDDREDYNVSISGSIIENRLLGRFGYSTSEYDGHTENEHPFDDLDPNGDSTDGMLGGWDEDVVNASLLFTPTDNLSIRLGYFKSESDREPQAFYNLDGARQNDVTNPENTLNCLDTTTTVRSGPSLVEVSGHHAWCGEMSTTPPYREDLAALGYNGDILMDPRSFAVGSETELWTLHVDWDFNDDWSVQYLYGYTDHDAAGTGIQADAKSVIGDGVLSGLGFDEDGNFGPLYTDTTVFNSNPEETLEASSHELQISWTGSDTVQARGGLYYSNVEDASWNRFFFIAPCNSAESCKDNTQEADPVLSDLFFPGSGHGLKGNWTEFEDDVYAIFAEVTWYANEKLTIGLEGRYTQEDKSYQQLTTTFGVEQELLNQEDFDYFTPRFTVEYHWTDSQLLYSSLGKGVKTGGFNSIDAEINPGQAVYDEEENWTLEVGSKNVLLNGSLVFNAAAYYIEWSDLQGSEAPDDPNPYATDVIGNIGDVEIYGIELETIYNLNQYWSFDAGFTYNNPEYEEAIYSPAVNDANSAFGCDDTLCPSDGDVSGNILARSSKRQAQVGVNYNYNFSDWSLTARLDANYRSKMYATPLNLGNNGSRTIGNLSMTLSKEHWDIGLWGKNITDEEYVANSFHLTSFSTYLVTLGPRASWGLSARYNF